ncbi:MAG: Undecaprenyl phosphate-alpha-4-amino-4-deoxy-L-arabinose arabinosyl transferase [Chroococcopsis gigantea SAG 12.99]|jgi:4-amino-4-deoxy-L-arabinose transferase-like glycosyltransferase|nr:glycosyltransferase family 39 protein [Chlorogloea purpurea SAG 13.99]MDV3001188.1 Undecaprenyl phosphate-alpha-4-amino-4-deoxy-L-arabinose arabinosyl transferase [Chroococcopsis gigantea SAG 12.99]
MNRQTFTWGYSGYKLRYKEDLKEFLCLAGLLIASLLLFTVNLGELTLRDWDEATIAQVAKEIWQASPSALKWLFPTFWGDPYLNKPPLIHSLIALAYSWGGESEWTTRLPGAILTAFSVPLLYLLGREIFPGRTSALLSALLYLTLLPVVRHGRLAMLDGAVLCFEILMMGCMLRSRRSPVWALGAGLGFSFLCLTKGILGVLLAGIAFIFLLWDTPRLLTSAYFWFGWFLGSTPALAWYGAQFFHYEQAFIDSLMAQQLSRVGQELDNHQGPPWYYLVEILKYGWPWLIFVVWGLRLAWQDYHYSWAKLVLVWSTCFLLIVSLMATKLPWYVMPVYPALALAGGHALAGVRHFPLDKPYHPLWVAILGGISLVTGILALVLYLNLSFSLTILEGDSLALILSALSLTTGTAAVLINQRSEQFIPILFWGMYVSLFLFVNSSFWIWELNEDFAVKPVAKMVQEVVSPAMPLYTTFDYERPSLNFYSGRRIKPLETPALKEYWQKQPHPYILIDDRTLSDLELDSVQILKQIPHWSIITKNRQS